MIAFVLVIIIGGEVIARDCATGALCFETGEQCERFASRLNNRPDLKIQARCEKQQTFERSTLVKFRVST